MFLETYLLQRRQWYYTLETSPHHMSRIQILAKKSQGKQIKRSDQAIFYLTWNSKDETMISSSESLRTSQDNKND